MSEAVKPSGKFTISQAIDSLGVSKFTISIFFLVGIAMMFDGYDYMIPSRARCRPGRPSASWWARLRPARCLTGLAAARS